MKHIYVFNSAVRGAEYGIGTYISQLSRVLQRSGYKITMVKIIFTDKEFTVETKKNVRYITIPAPVLKKDNKMEAFDRSVPVILYPYINADEENIFHLNYIGARSLAESLKNYYAGKLLLTVHYTDWSFTLLGNKNRFRRMLRQKTDQRDELAKTIVENFEKEKTTLGFCDKIVAISRHSYEDLLSIYGVNEAKVALINNALHNTYKKPNERRIAELKRKYNIDPREITIIYAGRLDYVKGVHMLVKAFKKVSAKYPGAKLIIAGEGSFKNLMYEAAPIWTKVSFTGFIGKKELNELYSIADIGVVPSLHEEFGYVAIEMMMHGIPVIAGNTSGLAEIISEGECGFKVKMKNKKSQVPVSTEELAEKISYLIENEEKRCAMGDLARKRYKKYYGLRMFERKMLELYDYL